MLFNSIEFALFLTLVVLFYFLSPFRYRVAFLVIASYFFYMYWQWEYGLLLAAQTAINFGCGWAISRAASQRSRQVLLAASISSSLGILFLFKYSGFFIDSVNNLFSSFSGIPSLPRVELVLPVGISFYTLQAVGYSIDVYRRNTEHESNPARFTLFVGFFPQLLSGPIERAGHMLNQFRSENSFDFARVSSGLTLMLWGLFKKVVIADRLAIYVNLVYNDPQGYSGSSLLLATYFFTFQIYCDFSGYTDMAIGAARILGYDLMANFRLPYFAESVSDFWRRWHISLTSWFRDYLYIPLGGNRTSSARWLLNIMAVFTISGLWHGAAWTFVIWGMLHGIYYLLERVIGASVARVCSALRIGGELLKWLKVLVTFHLVAFAWIFFKARSLTDALHVIGGIFTSVTGPVYLGPSQITTILGAGLILLLVTVQFLQYRGLVPLSKSERTFPLYVRWPVYVAMIFGISIFGIGSNEFIYFQF